MKQFDNSTPHLSDVYDSQIQNTVPYYEYFHNEVINIVKAAGINPGIWLDTGAGTGTLVKRCSEIFRDTLFLVSDPSVDMLEEAKTKLSNYADRVQYLEPAATQDLSLPENLRPDVITAIQSHHYLSREKRKDATKVCYDLLKEDGMFITFENTRPFTDKGIETGKKNWSRYQLGRGKSEEQVRNHMERFGKEYFPITIEEHINLYRDCGFKVVELLWYSYMQAGFYCLKSI